MDLSHWDWVETLSIHQIACLAVGLDPNVRPTEKEKHIHSKATALGLALESASERAWQTAARLTNEIDDYLDTPWSNGFELWESDSLNGDLPSMELMRNLTPRLRAEDKTPILRKRPDFVIESYKREHIRRWFQERNIGTVYAFPPHFNEVPISSQSTMNAKVIDLNASVANDAAVEKPLTTKERTTLLTIIAALLTEAGVDYTAIAKAGDHIERITLAIDAKVSTRAAQNHIRSIPDALQRKMPEA